MLGVGFMANNTNGDAQKLPRCLELLGVSEKGGRDEAPMVDGEIPRELKGSLYRNGPGLFERGCLRKPHLLDGDGLVQRLSFANGTVHYQNAFVRTEKFIEEEKADTFRFATWSMRRPGGLIANLGGRSIRSQAGVTVYPFNNNLYAIDEYSPVYKLDPQTLETIGEQEMGEASRKFSIKAHTKFDPLTGEWLLFGINHGRTMELHAVIYHAEGTLKAHHVIPSPRQVYIHDFFATREHFIFVLHPMRFSPWRFLSGQSSYMDALSWRAEEGNLVMVIPRTGGKPQFFDAPAAFIWHGLNAYSEGGKITADFVGYDAPDHFAPHDALFYKLMEGKTGVAKCPGKLRRYHIDLAARSLREEILNSGPLEFPMIDPRAAMQRHEVAYLTSGTHSLLHSAIKRIDYLSGEEQLFDFGADIVPGEPVFAAKPGGACNEGWLIIQCLDGRTERAFFALFDASHVDEGTIARIHLPHHLPISFHGWWKAD